MKVLVAPDKFRDALDAASVAAALIAGVRAAQPHAAVHACPLGDGGEGTGQILAPANSADERRLTVQDPLGRPRTARWWHAPLERSAIVEMAEASGLALLATGERNPLRTTSYGTGELLDAAIHAGCEHIVLCVGGSATVDGGAGCLQALGWRLFDAAGEPIDAPVTGGTLTDISVIEPPARTFASRVEILCDVDNPLLGPRGAAAAFGPQKGADPDAVRRLEAGLSHWAELLAAIVGRSVHTEPGTGAAGGLPAGLMSTVGARLRPGFEYVAQALELRERLRDCDLCLTGEGRLDPQTSGGKVVAGLARLAATCGVPVWAFVGAAEVPAGETLPNLARRTGLARIEVITPPGTPLRDALAATGANLRRAAESTLHALPLGPRP